MRIGPRFWALLATTADHLRLRPCGLKHTEFTDRDGRDEHCWLVAVANSTDFPIGKIDAFAVGGHPPATRGN